MPDLDYVTRKWLKDRYTGYAYLTREKARQVACPRCRMPVGVDCEMGLRSVRGVKAHPLRLFLYLDGISYARAVEHGQEED